MAVTFAAAVGSSVVAMLGKSHHPTLVDSTLVESSVRASDWSQGILAFIGALFTLGLINQVHDLWANAFGGGTFNPLSTLSHCLLGELGISISFSRKSTPI